MKPREYCCCAIPIVNGGIYTTLITQSVIPLVVGILSVATPSIVGAVTPSAAPWILAVVCFVMAALQILGFIGAAREKPILFRRYVSLHLLIALAAFAVAATWIILSATRHSTAKSNCLRDFFSNDSTSSEGDTLCNIFPWVDVGIMGGLWALLAILQIYLYIILSSYGTSQRLDHEKYDQLNNENIPMNARNELWDSRLSMDNPRTPQGYSHVRQESAASVSDVMNQPHLQPKDSLSRAGYDNYPTTGQEHLDRKTSKSGASSHPVSSYATRQNGPQYHDNYYNTTF